MELKKYGTNCEICEQRTQAIWWFDIHILAIIRHYKNKSNMFYNDFPRIYQYFNTVTIIVEPEAGYSIPLSNGFELLLSSRGGGSHTAFVSPAHSLQTQASPFSSSCLGSSSVFPVVLELYTFLLFSRL